MKKLTVFAAALLTAGIAMADSGLTRAQVTQQLEQARASGELATLNSEDSANFLRSPAATTSTTTRAQVVAELKKAQADGELAALNSDDSAVFLRQPSTSTVTRAQVRAELKMAQADGELAGLSRESSSYDDLVAATHTPATTVVSQAE
ncbi:MAG: DUF4148 domain-containing protein [Burkholderiaceae bacterium]